MTSGAGTGLSTRTWRTAHSAQGTCHAPAGFWKMKMWTMCSYLEMWFRTAERAHLWVHFQLIGKALKIPRKPSLTTTTITPNPFSGFFPRFWLLVCREFSLSVFFFGLHTFPLFFRHFISVGSPQMWILAYTSEAAQHSPNIAPTTVTLR